MTFPKPLGEKALQKMYREAGLTDQKIEYLHALFEGAANLYGAILLKDLWAVYETLTYRHPGTIKIKKKELAAFSSIVRRERHDYFVYEADELYSAEKRTDMHRILANNRLRAYERYTPFYRVFHAQSGKPFYVPGDLTEVKGPIITEEEDELRGYIENLTASSPFVYTLSGGEKVGSVSPHQGKKLSEFVYHDSSHSRYIEQLQSMLGKGSAERDEEIRESLSYMEVPFATAVMRTARAYTFNSPDPSSERISSLIADDIENVGVEITDEIRKELQRLISSFIDNANLYINRGWTPLRLAEIEKVGTDDIGQMPNLFKKEL